MSAKDIRLMLIKSKFPLTNQDKEPNLFLKNAQKEAKMKISSLVKEKLVLK